MHKKRALTTMATEIPFRKPNQKKTKQPTDDCEKSTEHHDEKKIASKKPKKNTDQKSSEKLMKQIENMWKTSGKRKSMKNEISGLLLCQKHGTHRITPQEHLRQWIICCRPNCV
jgi:hypothetical protein